MSENNNEQSESEQQDKPSRLAVAGSRSASLADNLNKEDWQAKTGRKLGAGSRSISLANSLDDNKGKDHERNDGNEDDKNTSSQK